jgi:hypothetical protein
MLVGLLLLTAGNTSEATAEDVASGEIRLCIPSLKTDNGTIDDAYRIAIGDLVGNVQPFKSGLLDRPVPVILAGLDYGRPWTRDASINAWNGASLIMPQVARNTLVSVLDRTEGGIRIGGQYWDCIVWATGAWHHYLYTRDREFLCLAFEATRNSLAYFEQTEFDPCVPSGISFVEIQNMKYRNMDLTITIRGGGAKVKECTISGRASDTPLLESSELGTKRVVLTMAQG